MNIAQVAEWSIASDCKSLGLGLRGFESLPAHRKSDLVGRFLTVTDLNCAIIKMFAFLE